MQCVHPLRFDTLIPTMYPLIAAKQTQHTPLSTHTCCFACLTLCLLINSILSETLDQPVQQLAEKMYNTRLYKTTVLYLSLGCLSVTAGQQCFGGCTAKKCLVHSSVVHASQVKNPTKTVHCSKCLLYLANLWHCLLVVLNKLDLSIMTGDYQPCRSGWNSGGANGQIHMAWFGTRGRVHLGRGHPTPQKKNRIFCL